jgi:AcrR family transcriptional regulator
MVSDQPPIPEKADITTHDRLLDAAVDVFGKHGFEAATTRMIAKEAKVNIAAIPYYFNGKEGLYQAAVTAIVERIEAEVAGVLAEIASQPFTETTSREAALALLEKLLVTIITFMVGSPQAPRVARIILREQLDPSSAYDIIFNRFLAPVIGSVATLVMHAAGESSERTAKLRAMAIMGQIIAFRVGRETMVRALGLQGYSAEETAEIRQIILTHTRALITGMGSAAG